MTIDHLTGLHVSQIVKNRQTETTLCLDKRAELQRAKCIHRLLIDWLNTARGSPLPKCIQALPPATRLGQEISLEVIVSQSGVSPDILQALQIADRYKLANVLLPFQMKALNDRKDCGELLKLVRLDEARHMPGEIAGVKIVQSAPVLVEVYVRVLDLVLPRLTERRAGFQEKRHDLILGDHRRRLFLPTESARNVVNTVERRSTPPVTRRVLSLIHEAPVGSSDEVGGSIPPAGYVEDDPDVLATATVPHDDGLQPVLGSRVAASGVVMGNVHEGYQLLVALGAPAFYFRLQNPVALAHLLQPRGVQNPRHTGHGMKAVTVSDAQGRDWRVEVRWLPWAPRWRGPRPKGKKKEPGDTRWYDWIDLAEPIAWFDEGLAGFVTAIVFVVLLVMAVLFLLPAFILLVEILIVVLVVVAAVLIRVLFRRPWIVDAFPVDDPSAHLVWKVVGTGRAKETVDIVAQQLAAGIEVPQAPGAELVKQPPLENPRREDPPAPLA